MDVGLCRMAMEVDVSSVNAIVAMRSGLYSESPEREEDEKGEFDEREHVEIGRLRSVLWRIARFCSESGSAFLQR